MLRRFTKKRLVLLAVPLAALALAGGAFAYFTSSGSGTGQAAVGQAGAWTVTPGTASGTMYPGAGSTTIPYTVTNSGSGHQQLNATTTAVVADASGNVKSNGTSVPGCLATWFSTANTAPASADLAAGGTATGSVSVSMSDASANQNACQGVTPDIQISAN